METIKERAIKCASQFESIHSNVAESAYIEGATDERRQTLFNVCKALRENGELIKAFNGKKNVEEFVDKFYKYIILNC